jgi:cell division septum initiation protein DivIVA
MTDEERQRAMDFIVRQQAKNEVELERINESFRKAEHRFDRDERILELMIKADERAHQHMRTQDEHSTRRHAELRESHAERRKSQAHSDRRLDALIDIVRQGKNSKS